MVIKILYLLSGRLAPQNFPSPTSQKAIYKQCGTMEQCAGGMWKTWDFYVTVSAIIGMGQGIYCAFSLINVTKHGACQCAPRTLSPPHADSHELGGNRQKTHIQMHKQIQMFKHTQERKKREWRQGMCIHTTLHELSRKLVYLLNFIFHQF